MTDITQHIPQKAKFPDRWQDEVPILFKLGAPFALAQLVQFSVYTIDTLMIGRLGELDLAAASLGVTLFFVTWMVGSGAVMSVTPMVSQALGANQKERHDVRISVRMMFWLVLAMIPLSIGFAFCVEPLALALGQDPDVSRKASYYMFTLTPGLPFALAIMGLRNFLAAIDRMWVPLGLAILVTVINAGLNWVFIYGNLGAPRLELIGAGIASSLSYAISFGLFLAYCYIDPLAKSFRLLHRVWRPHWSRFADMLRLGWPISLTTLFEGMLFNAAVFIVGIIGTTEQAAYHVGLNIAALCFMIPFGFSMAGSVRVGLAAGAGNLAAVKRVSAVTLGLCLFLMGLLALIVAKFPVEIAGLYLEADKLENAAVIAMTASFLPIAAAFMLFDATQVVANQLLRGLKDVTVPMILTGISYWVIGFPIAVYLGLYTAHSAKGVWYGLMAGLIATALLLGARYIWYMRHKAAVIYIKQETS